MDPVDLPTHPAPVPSAIAWSIVDAGGTVRGALGGSDQRINRLGNRWRVELPLPAMVEADARRWTSRLNRGLRKGVRWRIIQPGFAIGIPGAPLIDGADQGGDRIAVRAFTPSYVVRYGQRFSLLSGGRRYVHEAAETAVIGTGGTGAIEIEPILRASPEDGAPLEFGQPFLEGLLESPAEGQFGPDMLMRGLTIAIREVR